MNSADNFPKWMQRFAYEESNAKSKVRLDREILKLKEDLSGKVEKLKGKRLLKVEGSVVGI